MPELPILSPSIQIQPSISTQPSRQDVGAGSGFQTVASGVSRIIAALKDLDDQDSLADAHVKLAENQFVFDGQLLAAKDKILDPKAFRKELVKIQTQFLKPKDADELRSQLGAKAYNTYLAGMADYIAARARTAVQESVMLQHQIVNDKFEHALATHVNDVSVMEPGQARDAKLAEVTKLGEDINLVLFPDRDKRMRTAFQQIAIGFAEADARRNPLQTITDLDKGKQQLVTVGNQQYNIFAFDPDAKNRIRQAAMNELNFRHGRAEQEKTLALEDFKQQQESAIATIRLLITQNDPDALKKGREFAKVNNRLLIDSDEENKLFHYQESLKASKARGETTVPEAYGEALSKILYKNLHDPTVIMELRNISTEDKQRLESIAISHQIKLKDENYARFNKFRKDGEDFIRAMYHAQNPISGFGKVDAVVESAIALFRSQADTEEDKITKQIRTTGLGDYRTVPVQAMAQAIVDNSTPSLANQYKHDVKKIVQQVAAFVPPIGDITYPKIYENIQASLLTKNEKGVYTSLVRQMQKQGITPQQISQKMYGTGLEEEKVGSRDQTKLIEQLKEMLATAMETLKERTR